MDHHEALSVFETIADAVGEALEATTDWDDSGQRQGQYAVDLVADRIVLEALGEWGVSVLSEESGLSLRATELLVVVDPLDGSTNASQGIPWYATSLCLVDDEGAAVGLVRNQSNGVTYAAVRGLGAFCDGRAITASGCDVLADAMVGISGLPPRHLGWRQFRAFGAVALDLCLVADGGLDGFVDCSVDAHGVWDYAAGVLICREAGAVVTDGFQRDLFVRDPALKRTPVAAATPRLLDQLVEARQSF